MANTSIEALQPPGKLYDAMLKMAALNIVLCEEEDMRYHRFTKGWSEGVDMSEVNNGAGDNMFLLFTDEGAVIKGFDHESPLSPHAQDVYAVRKGMYDGLPETFSRLLDDPALEKEEATFCLWREKGDAEWKKGNVTLAKDESDGSGFLLGTIESTAEDFKDWADDYFEIDLPLHVLREFYETGKLTEEMILALNEGCDVEKVKEELKELGL